MTMNDTTSSKPKKQSDEDSFIDFTKILRSCIIPSSIGGMSLIAILYACSFVSFKQVGEFFGEFFLIDIEYINYMFFFIYLNIFLLSFSLCVCVKYSEAHNVEVWEIAFCLLFLCYFFLIGLYSYNFLWIDSLPPFQDNLALFVWLPVWCLVAVYLYYMLK